MPKPYKQLRDALTIAEIRQQDLADKLDCHLTHVNQCMRGKADWRLSEAYRTLDVLGEPPERLPEFFPRDATGR